MNKAFLISATIAFILISVLAGLYDYFVYVVGINIGYRLILKICPMMVLIFLSFTHLIISKITLYSCGILFSLLMFTIADLFLAMYEPGPDNTTAYIIFGGSFFFVARLLLAVVFSIKPRDHVCLINYDYKTLIISHFAFSSPFIILSITNMIYFQTFISYLIGVYMILGFGLPLSYAYLRINNSELEESKSASIFAFVGVLLFNISDIFLFISMFTQLLPAYFIVISDNIYWLSMFLITISMDRVLENYQIFEIMDPL